MRILGTDIKSFASCTLIAKKPDQAAVRNL